jgi:hypothetical protein
MEIRGWWERRTGALECAWQRRGIGGGARVHGEGERRGVKHMILAR